MKLEIIQMTDFNKDSIDNLAIEVEFLRKQVTHNTIFSNFKEFQLAIARFIVKHEYSSPEMKRRCCYAKLYNAS
jgi:hypothetical protein